MTESAKLNLINRNKKIIEIIMKQIDKECPDSVDMVAVGGSFCNGDIYEKSDLDLVIVSRDERAKCLDKCFILDDVAMDVYTQDWTSFEHMAEYSHPYVTKLIDLDIIYVHDDDVIKRYKALQRVLLNNMNNDELINTNIQKHFSNLAFEWNSLNLNKNSIGDAYRSLGHIVKDVEFIVYLFNKSYVKRGSKRVPEEICSMEILPDGFMDIYKDITNCKTIEKIKEKANLLFECVKDFLCERGISCILDNKKKNVIEKHEIKPNNLFGTYEEIYSNWKNKMIHAIAINNRYLSFVTMNSCQEFYDEMYDMFYIPKIELIEHYNPSDLKSNAEVFDNCMEEWLKLYKQFGIKINYYADLKALEDMYKNE